MILVESGLARGQSVPQRLFEMIPHLQIYYFDTIKSANLKDYGVSLSSGKYVAVLESDCLPCNTWLRQLVTLLERGNYQVASGRTWYGDESSYRRVMNLLHRSWYDSGKSGKIDYISNNGAVYNRELLQKFPYPDAATPFISAQIRNVAIRKAGHKFYFERTVMMRHAIGGLSFVWDLQRNKGHQSMSAQHRRSAPTVFKLLFLRIRKVIELGIRHGQDYLRWHDWPLLVLAMSFEIVPFAIGTIDALRQVKTIPHTAYR